MEISPVYGTRALKVLLEDEKILSVGDLHLGISAELADKGIEIPNQTPKIQKRLQTIIENENADRLFFLGDIKHNIPITSWEEWEYLPDFFSDLSNKVKIEIVPGNHDGDIKGLIPRDVILHGAEGATAGDGKVGFLHGHAWPDPKLLRAEAIVLGHNHPVIEFKDDLGARITEPAWVRTSLKQENLPKRLQKEMKGEGPEITIAPAFSTLIGGGAINRQIPEKLIGPLFKAGAIDMKEAEIYLLDGAYLGKLKNLRELTEPIDSS